MDRTNNSLGYTLSNVVPCCKTCNRAKGDKNIEEFLEIIKRIINYQSMTDYKKYIVHCKKNSYDVYCGRPSEFGNPYSHKENTLAEFKVATREEAIEKYREYIYKPEQAWLRIKVRNELKDKILSCWCAPLSCHCEILAEIANKEEEKEYKEMGDEEKQENKIGWFRDSFGFLSNFEPCDIEYEGILYPSVEHAYQAQKTLDISKRKRVSELKSPAAAKTMGRGFKLRDDWEDIKLSVMYECLKKKFASGSLLSEMLLATEDVLLEEGNMWHDCVFGICHCKSCGSIGSNMLGKLLMKIRNELKENI